MDTLFLIVVPSVTVILFFILIAWAIGTYLGSRVDDEEVDG